MFWTYTIQGNDLQEKISQIPAWLPTRMCTWNKLVYYLRQEFTILGTKYNLKTVYITKK